jgi:pellino protein
LQEKATKWYSDGEIDGLTTNGILIMHPTGGFNPGAQAGIWREVSVGGGIYALRESRSTPQKSSLVSVVAESLH